MLLFYIRHGDPIYTPDSLTPRGERQAEALAKRLGLFGLNRVFTSTSNRAKLTAKPTCELLNLTPVELDWCNENHTWRELAMVNAEGRRMWLFQNNEILPLLASKELLDLGDKWYLHDRFANTTYREGMERIQKEADAFLAELGYRHCAGEGYYTAEKPTDERVALFAHQGFGLAFLSCILDIPYPKFCSHFDMSHSSMTVIAFNEFNGIAIPKVLQLSNDSHLYREGILTGYNNGVRF